MVLFILLGFVSWRVGGLFLKNSKKLAFDQEGGGPVDNKTN